MPGRTTFQGIPSCGWAVILMSVVHCPYYISPHPLFDESASRYQELVSSGQNNNLQIAVQQGKGFLLATSLCYVGPCYTPYYISPCPLFDGSVAHYQELVSSGQFSNTVSKIWLAFRTHFIFYMKSILTLLGTLQS